MGVTFASLWSLGISPSSIDSLNIIVRVGARLSSSSCRNLVRSRLGQLRLQISDSWSFSSSPSPWTSTVCSSLWSPGLRLWYVVILSGEYPVKSFINEVGHVHCLGHSLSVLAPEGPRRLSALCSPLPHQRKRVCCCFASHMASFFSKFLLCSESHFFYHFLLFSVCIPLQSPHSSKALHILFFLLISRRIACVSHLGLL